VCDVDAWDVAQVEQLIERMTFLRERGDNLSHDARRERAAGAAMEMARLFGELDGDDDDDSEGEGQVV
jgi:hypothetical protein